MHAWSLLTLLLENQKMKNINLCFSEPLFQLFLSGSPSCLFIAVGVVLFGALLQQKDLISSPVVFFYRFGKLFCKCFEETWQLFLSIWEGCQLSKLYLLIKLFRKDAGEESNVRDNSIFLK